MRYLNTALFASESEDLEPLVELALDLRNCWDHTTDAIWSRIEPELWTAPTTRGWCCKQRRARN